VISSSSLLSGVGSGDRTPKKNTAGVITVAVLVDRDHTGWGLVGRNRDGGSFGAPPVPASGATSATGANDRHVRFLARFSLGGPDTSRPLFTCSVRNIIAGVLRFSHDESVSCGVKRSALRLLVPSSRVDPHVRSQFGQPEPLSKLSSPCPALFHSSAAASNWRPCDVEYFFFFWSTVVFR
jgi:hypothetical protein